MPTTTTTNPLTESSPLPAPLPAPLRPAPEGSSASTRPPASRRRRGWRALAAVAALGGVAAVVLGVLGSRRQEAAGAVPTSAAPSPSPPSPSDRAGATTAAGRGDSSDPTPVVDPSPVALAAATRAHNAITLTRVHESRLAGDIQLTGSVSYDADHLAMVGPLVAGRVARLDTQVGARVRRGQVLAEIESVDVGQARAELISAGARLGAATSNLERERELAEKKISSSREREVAEAQWAIERAAVRAARERLRAIGLSDTDIQAVETRDEDAPTGGRVPIRSPIEGTIIERLVTLGEAVQSASDAFKVADLRRVWVQLDLYEKDLARVRVSLPVEIRTDAYPGEIFQGRVAYVAPVIDEATRTAKVRVEIDNRQDKLHIGQLVSAKLSGRAQVGDAAVLVIPRSAVQRLDGKPLVFVKVAAGFERAFVELGAAGDDWIEVRRGLSKDQEIAADGGFLLKSELLR